MTTKLVVGASGAQEVELTPEEEAQRIVDAEKHATRLAADAAIAVRLDSVKADAGLQDLANKLKTMTPAEWNDYLTNNMTTLAQARVVVYRMGLALMLLARQI
jgi:hypothetical protein